MIREEAVEGIGGVFDVLLQQKRGGRKVAGLDRREDGPVFAFRLNAVVGALNQKPDLPVDAVIELLDQRQ